MNVGSCGLARAARRLFLPALALGTGAGCGLIIGDNPTQIIPVSGPDASPSGDGGASDGQADARASDSSSSPSDARAPDSSSPPDGSVSTEADASGSVAAVDISAWEYHACAVRLDGRISCWGDNTRDSLGNGAAYWNPVPFPVVIPDAGPLTGVIEVTLGLDHACARNGDAGVRCWGSRDYGATGFYYPATNAIPPGDPIPGAFAQVRAKGWYYDEATYPEADPWGDFSCAIDTSGHVQCWGANAHFAIGEANDGGAGSACGPFLCDGTPITVLGISNATRLALDDGGGCAASADGTVSCWGWDGDDELGNSSGDAPTATPVLMGDGGANPIVDLAAGHNTICAVQQSGTMYCWGRNVEYEFGIPSLGGQGVDSTVPALFAQEMLAQISAVTIGRRHVCVAAGPSSEAWCTGWNGEYEMGNGTMGGDAPNCTVCAAEPTAVLRADGSRLTGVVQLAAGWESTCARTSDGAVYCWGSNYLGAAGHAPGSLGDVPCELDYCTPYATLVSGI